MVTEFSKFVPVRLTALKIKIDGDVTYLGLIKWAKVKTAPRTMQIPPTMIYAIPMNGFLPPTTVVVVMTIDFVPPNIVTRKSAINQQPSH